MFLESIRVPSPYRSPFVRERRLRDCHPQSAPVPADRKKKKIHWAGLSSNGQKTALVNYPTAMPTYAHEKNWDQSAAFGLAATASSIKYIL